MKYVHTDVCTLATNNMKKMKKKLVNEQLHVFVLEKETLPCVRTFVHTSRV